VNWYRQSQISLDEQEASEKALRYERSQNPIAEEVREHIKNPKPKKPRIPKKNKGGDCYEVAGRYVMDNGMFGRGSDLVLVHGEVTGQGRISGVKYGHAWVEQGDMVIDRSNGRDLRIPKNLYYALGNISRTIKYTPEEMRKKAAEFKHWGPWDLQTEY
jgi:hypothetical protein